MLLCDKVMSEKVNNSISSVTQIVVYVVYRRLCFLHTARFCEYELGNTVSLSILICCIGISLNRNCAGSAFHGSSKNTTAPKVMIE